MSGLVTQLDDWISAVQSRYHGTLPFEIYRQIESRLPWTDRPNFRKRLSKMDFVITGFAKRPNGDDVAVAIGALSVATPFTLTSVLNRDVSSWPRSTRRWLLGSDDAFFPATIREWFERSSDEVWAFSSDANSWRTLSGRAGLARLRENVVIDLCTTVMN